MDFQSYSQAADTQTLIWNSNLQSVSPYKFLGDFSGNFAGNLGGNLQSVSPYKFLGDFSGNFAGNLGGNLQSVSPYKFLGDFSGNFAGIFTGKLDITLKLTPKSTKTYVETNSTYVIYAGPNIPGISISGSFSVAFSQSAGSGGTCNVQCLDVNGSVLSTQQVTNEVTINIPAGTTKIQAIPSVYGNLAVSQYTVSYAE